MSNENQITGDAQVLTVEDLGIEELDEVAGAGSFSCVGTASTPASLGSAACWSSL
ncbi:thiocillin family RiPP [Streptacidiphilus jiangxiensis]|uniref:Uncharacterized protein n=1 Tax=Streptacidiphilus jiangxiensis TaxID=235985 RepID=A0A1H7KS58_STRJI|nr:thiocillin family RiPP [Streptacidiphilus jiangxiensis]SEK89602.1 hypothetical protein SAMN05414137_104178 [Streptacidiphilus jiangxiensis]